MSSPGALYRTNIDGDLELPHKGPRGAPPAIAPRIAARVDGTLPPVGERGGLRQGHGLGVRDILYTCLLL